MYFYIYACFICVCQPEEGVGFSETGYQQLTATMWMLEIEPGSSWTAILPGIRTNSYYTLVLQQSVKQMFNENCKSKKQQRTL